MPSWTDANYGHRVYSTPAVADEIVRLCTLVRVDGQGDAFLDALRLAHQQLTDAPATFGERLFPLQALRLQIRTAAIRPISITFSVSDDLREVYIRSLQFIPQPGR